MAHTKLSFLLIIFMLISVVTFVARLEAQDTENNRSPVQEFVKKAQEYVKQNQIEKATELYERIVKGAPEDVESRAQLVTLYTRTKQYEKAAQTWEKLLEADPENTKYQDGLVYNLRAAGEVDEAFDIAQTYIQTEPEVGAHYARLARLYEAGGEVNAAITNYEKAIELAPGDIQVQTYLKLAEHYIIHEDIAAAERILKNAMLYTKSEFDRQDIELQLIKLYLYEGNLEEVLQKIEDEGTPLSYEMSKAKERAQHFRNTGELKKSAAYFKIALITAKNSYDRDNISNERDNISNERDNISNELLEVYLEQDRTDLALELYETEASEQSRSTLMLTAFSPFDINIKFGSDDARKILVNAYKNRGQLDVLRTLLENKLEKDADNADVLELLAEVYWDVNDYENAAEAYHALSKVEPNNIRSFYLAAITFQKSNQPDMAKELLDRAEAALTSVNYRQDGSFLGALATICLKNEMYDPAIKLAGNAIIEAQNFVDPAIELAGNAFIEAQNKAQNNRYLRIIWKSLFVYENLRVMNNYVNTYLRIIWKSRLGLAEYYSKNNMPNKAMEQMLQTGIVHEKAWLILGPFDNTTGIGYDTKYIPENTTQIDLTAKYEGVNKQISWKKFSDAAFNGFIDFGEDVNWCVSYAWTTITSPDEREVFFRFSSDDQSKIWLNGKEVFTNPNAKAAILDRHTIPVTLKAGKNTILVKVCNEEMSWGFYLRVTDVDGKPYEDLQYSRLQNN